MALSDGPAQPTSPLTNEDVARLLHDLGIKMSTIETYSNSMGEAVTYNSGLLNALVTRVNTIETTSDLTTGVIDQLTEDVKKAMITINEDGMRQDRADAGKDSALRTELSAMAAKLELGHVELSARMGQCESAQAVYASSSGATSSGATSSPNPGLALKLGQLERSVVDLETKVTSWSEKQETRDSKIEVGLGETQADVNVLQVEANRIANVTASLLANSATFASASQDSAPSASAAASGFAAGKGTDGLQSGSDWDGAKLGGGSSGSGGNPGGFGGSFGSSGGSGGPSGLAADQEGSVDPEVAEVAEVVEAAAPPAMRLALRRVNLATSLASGTCMTKSSLCRVKRCMTPRIQLHGSRCCATTLLDGHPRWM